MRLNRNAAPAYRGFRLFDNPANLVVRPNRPDLRRALERRDLGAAHRLIGGDDVKLCAQRPSQSCRLADPARGSLRSVGPNDYGFVHPRPPRPHTLREAARGTPGRAREAAWRRTRSDGAP